MASHLGHFLSFYILYILFPHLNPIALFIASQLPDLDYVQGYVLALMRKKGIFGSYTLLEPKSMHTLLWAALFLLPLGIVFTVIISLVLSVPYALPSIVSSVIIGLSIHLLIDLPGHRNLPLFRPFKDFPQNPVLFRYKFSFLRLDDTHAREWSYIIVADTILAISAIAVTILKQ
ncbi:MAG: hypothetical protein HGA85_02340 [Nanoarchaeota archaeon]|nr:hypothetical protein [Nanoarchaeota archaeon]